MMSSSDRGLAILRAGVGFSLLFLFGITKVKAAAAFAFAGKPWGLVEFNRSVGLPMPALLAFVHTFNESAGALMFALGIFTRAISIWLALAFAVAGACSLRAHEQGWPFTAGYLSLIFIAVAVSGGGRFSIDGLRRREKH